MSAQQHRASRCVFVGNIPYDATEEQLVQICEEVGPVVSFRLVVDRDTGKPKGYGFCEFRDEETALSARRNLQGYDINGRQLRVDFAENEKGGGGVDRNRDQGRGGPGFQQTESQKSVGANLQPGYAGGGATPLEQQPMGRAAASAAALMMAGALGGAQQIPNMMLQPQVPMQAMNAPPNPLTGNGGGIPAGADALTNALSGMSKQQLYDVMSQMKTYIQQNQMQARQTLVQHPQLTKALFQAQIMLGMVRPPQVVASQPAQAQQLPPPQQGVMQPQQQLQPPPPRPLQPHAPPAPTQMQPQPSNKNTFSPMPQPQQQQIQAPPPQQQQQQQMPPPPPQGSFQGMMGQTSLGMGFQQGPPPPPNQPPLSQLYQMGGNLMGANVPRMGTNSGGSQVGQGNGGILPAAGGIGPAGTGQIARGLGNMDGRGVQLNHGLPPSSGSVGGLSGVPGQSPMQMAGHALVGGSGGGAGGMGQSLPNALTGSQLMGDPSGRGYSGLNSGITSQMNSMNPGVNAGLNANMNNAMNGPLNSGLNPAMNPGMPQGLNQGFNSAMNVGLNPAMNAGLHSNMPVGIGAMNAAGLSMGLNAPQIGGFGGTTTGTAVATAALQSQPYPQMQAAPAAQQLQGQVPLELEQQKALLQQVMNLTSDQIMSLPPDQRQQVLQLQQALGR